MVEKLDYHGREFLERALAKHDKVARLRPLPDDIYILELKDGRSLRLFATNMYGFGMADLLEVLEANEKIDCVLNVSQWNHYSTEAKQFAMKNRIGLFRLAEFMGALNWREFWKYTPPHERKKRK